MIQLNLLPDVKLQYLKANRLKKMITSIAILCTIISVGLLTIVVVAGFAEKARIASVDKSIKSKTTELKAKKGINKVLTVQNQLDSLTALHSQKPAVSSLFTYLNQVTPVEVGINDLHVDFVSGSEKMTITGTSKALSSVNKYIDTLKFTKYTVGEDKTETQAFSNIVLSSFALSNSTAGQSSEPATYTIDLAFDRKIFDITEKVTLKVPKKTTTRSAVDAPSEIFQAGGVQ